MLPQPESEAAHEESKLLAQSGRGDREAFRRLYERYSTPLFSLAVRLVGNTSDAEEMLQDAFVKIWRNAAAYDARRSRPFTWAVTVLRRTCIDHMRKRRHHFVTSPAFPDDDGSVYPFAAGDARLAAQIREDSDLVLGALASIAPDQRRALELALFSEMTRPEIARRLEKPLGTVKSWIRRGLLQLRTILADSHYEL